MESTALDYFETLEEEIREHPALNHPFLEKFRQGKLSLDRIRIFARQYYLYSRWFGRYLSAIVANIPDERPRTLLIKNLYQEYGEGNTNNSHPAIFRRFMKALRLDSREVEECEPLPEMHLFIHEYLYICQGGHFLKALGAIGPGTESIVPYIYRPIYEGLKKEPSLKEEDIEFFALHITLDVEHSANIKEALLEYARSERNQALIRQGAMTVLSARTVLWNGLERACCG
ncbi:MAG: iron-containing redox enzyme family protein [Candidatus Brocadiales bacterium]|nr:iron-containing redox enzyme family protein [Candidatus Bathyanammoxibius amoris]